MPGVIPVWYLATMRSEFGYSVGCVGSMVLHTELEAYGVSDAGHTEVGDERAVESDDDEAGVRPEGTME